MVKKFPAIVLFSLAFVIQLAHSVVPHSHADHHENEQHHHHDDNTENQSIFHFYSHSQHSTEIFTSQTEDVKINVAGDIQAVVIATNHSSAELKFCSNTLPTTGFDEPYIFISPHLVSLKFRGPPTV